MLAIKEETPLRFYKPEQREHLETLVKDIYMVTCEDAGFSMEYPSEWSVPVDAELKYNAEDWFVSEIIHRQAFDEDLTGLFSMEESKEALEDEEKYDDMVMIIRDYMSYNGSFTHNTHGVEMDFLKDILFIMDYQNLFRLEHVEEATIGKGVYHCDDQLFVAKNSSLQEVW